MRSELDLTSRQTLLSLNPARRTQCQFKSSSLFPDVDQTSSQPVTRLPRSVQRQAPCFELAVATNAKDRPDARHLLSNRPLALLSLIPRPAVLFTAGAVSGAIGKTITAPLDRVKLLLQTSGGLQQGAVKQAVRKGGVWQALVAIGRTEGIKGYWKGNLPQVGHAGTYFALAGHAFSLPTSKPTLHCTANPNSKTCQNLCISVALRIAHVCILICLFNRLSLLGSVALLMNADLEGCAIQCHAAVFV